MEFSFSKLKKLDVISVSDGKNLGRFCDVTFTLPEGKIKVFFTTGCKGFKFGKPEVFIPLGDIVKVGEDAILVKTGGKPPKPPCPPKPHNDSNQPNCPPPPPPCPPGGNPFNAPYNPPYDSRRSFDDYE